jgi:GDP-4-dehydro-6-deoxy-D-mannose reductase
MSSPNRILVTGADGFVGRFLLRTLRTAFPSAFLIACAREPVMVEADQTLPLDLLSTDSIADCLAEARADAIVHLAAATVVPESFADPRLTWRINVDGTLALAQMVMRTTPETLLLYISSAETYGLTFQRGVPLDEDAPFAPANPYAASKAAADLALGEMALRGLNVIRMRTANHTGPGQSDALVVPAFAHQLARIEAGQQEPVLRVGALDRWRDFLDVRDVCAAYAAALSHGQDLAPGTAFNIASGTPRRIGDLLDALIARIGLAVEIQTDATRLRPTDVVKAIGNPGRAKAMLGWEPKIPWDETLDSVLDDWRKRVRA